MMQKRKIDELISHFNRKVADMDIDRKYKMELLGMITAIGIACEKELSIEPEHKAVRWIPCSERLPSKADHIDNMVLVCYGNGSVRFNTYMNGWVQGNPVAWMPLPEPYKGEQE